MEDVLIIAEEQVEPILDTVMDEPVFDLDCNVWPLDNSDLERLTGIIESEHMNETEYEKGRKQKMWKEEAQKLG